EGVLLTEISVGETAPELRSWRVDMNLESLKADTLVLFFSG
ncbi:3989_t:CDS:1, partial [Acaulospora colombiana]